MKNRLLVGLVAVLLGAAGAAQAEVGVTTSLGTTGLGVHLTVPVQSNLNARFGMNALNYSYSGTSSNVDYDFKLKLKTFDALLDYYPMDGQFRISGGLIYNGNKIDANGRSNSAGTYTLNGKTYSSADIGSVNGKVDFRKIAPYLGIGWGNAVSKEKGWGFSTDLGVMFQGSPNTTLTSSGCNLPSTAACETLASDLAAQNRDLADKANDFKAYPVVRVGVSYKF
jgi:hypothetical protein